MALGGTTIAQAASSSPSHPAEKVAAHDGDNIQSGDQTSPDPSSPASAAQRAVHGRQATRSAEPNDESPENSTENGPSDGPGGHADPPGNVDHQFSGEE